MNQWARRHRDSLLGIGAIWGLVLLWELSAGVGLLNSKFFPPPSRIMDTFGFLIASGQLPWDVGITTLRVLEGFIIGAVPAILLGMVMGFSGVFRALLLPVSTAIYALPKIAIYPLVIVILGLGEVSKVAIVAISIFFLVLLNTMTGVLSLERAYLDVGRSFGASRRQMLWTIALPGALPMVFAGSKLALGFGLVVIVGAEFLGSQSGIGSLIWNSYQTFRLEQMYVGLIATAVMGLAFNSVLDILERRFTPWRAAADVPLGLRR